MPEDSTEEALRAEAEQLRIKQAEDTRVFKTFLKEFEPRLEAAFMREVERIFQALSINYTVTLKISELHKGHTAGAAGYWSSKEKKITVMRSIVTAYSALEDQDAALLYWLGVVAHEAFHAYQSYQKDIESADVRPGVDPDDATVLEWEREYGSQSYAVDERRIFAFGLPAGFNLPTEFLDNSYIRDLTEADAEAFALHWTRYLPPRLSRSEGRGLAVFNSLTRLLDTAPALDLASGPDLTELRALHTELASAASPVAEQRVRVGLSHQLAGMQISYKACADTLARLEITLPEKFRDALAEWGTNAPLSLRVKELGQQSRYAPLVTQLERLVKAGERLLRLEEQGEQAAATKEPATSVPLATEQRSGVAEPAAYAGDPSYVPTQQVAAMYDRIERSHQMEGREISTYTRSPAIVPILNELTRGGLTPSYVEYQEDEWITKNAQGITIPLARFEIGFERDLPLVTELFRLYSAVVADADTTPAYYYPFTYEQRLDPGELPAPTVSLNYTFACLPETLATLLETTRKFNASPPLSQQTPDFSWLNRLHLLQREPVFRLLRKKPKLSWQSALYSPRHQGYQSVRAYVSYNDADEDPKGAAESIRVVRTLADSRQVKTLFTQRLYGSIWQGKPDPSFPLTRAYMSQLFDILERAPIDP